MRNLTKYQSVVWLLDAICDGCGENREALLSTWVVLDDSGNVSTRMATSVHILEDPMIGRVFAQDASGKDINVLMHFEKFTDEERQIRFMQYIKNLDGFFWAGLYNLDQCYVEAREFGRELSKDIQKESCGAFDFYDAETGRLLDFPHVIETCDPESMFALTV